MAPQPKPAKSAEAATGSALVGVDRRCSGVGVLSLGIPIGFTRPAVTCNIEVMATPHEDPSVTRRVRSYRQRMRAQGMRPIQMWVADVRAPGFAAEAHRQSAAVADSDHAADDQAFIDAVSLDEA